MEYYSAIKRNEIELFVVRRMDLESVIKSEVSQKEKNKKTNKKKKKQTVTDHLLYAFLIFSLKKFMKK